MNMHDLDEKSFNEWLKTYEEDSSFANYKIERTSAKSVLKVNDSIQFKSNVHVLPFSIENNSTVAGSGAIIHEFGNMFGLPQVDTNKYLPYMYPPNHSL